MENYMQTTTKNQINNCVDNKIIQDQLVKVNSF